MTLDDELPKGWKIWCRKRVKGYTSAFDVWLLEYNDQIVWSGSTRMRCVMFMKDVLQRRKTHGIDGADG